MDWLLIFLVAFVSAAVNERFGRDARIGGLTGFLLALVFGPLTALVMTAIWVVFARKDPAAFAARPRRWYTWWLP